MKMTGFAKPAGDKAYFFLGSHYVRYNVGGDLPEGVESGYPLPIAEQWPALPFSSDIDACLSWSDGSVYFFRGDQCVQYDVGVPITVPRATGDRIRLRVREVEEALTLDGATAASGELGERVVYTDLVRIQ